MKFCPVCQNYLYLDTDETGLKSKCHSCGHIAVATEDSDRGLIMETIVQQRSSEGYKILLNEFTRQDPTLPHAHTLPCPSSTCTTNTSGVKKDVIIIKYDAINMKFLYICDICGIQWRSR